METDPITSERVSLGSWRRFSLREILLATTAIAALVVVFREESEPTPTSFIRNCDIFKLMTSLTEEQGLPMRHFPDGPPASGITGTVQNPNIGRYGMLHADLTFNWQKPLDLRAKLMPALYRHIREQLAEEGCEFRLLAPHPSRVQDELVDFMIRYQRGNGRGFCVAKTAYDNKGRFQLFLVMEEL